MSQGITGGLVPAYATLAANLFALSAAFNFLKQAADIRNLRESQIQFTETTGVAMGMLTTNLREAADGMLSFQAAAQASAIGVAKGFSPQQMESIAQGARKVSTALGRDFEDAFDRLVRGASKAEPELLDELGITLRLANATNKYAQAIGKNVKDLTEYERSQAVLKETMGQLEHQFGQVIPKTNEFTKLGKTFGDVVEKVSNAALPAIESFVGFINDNMGSAVAIVGLFGASILQSALNFGALEEKALDFADSMSASAKAAQDDLAALNESQQTTIMGKGRVKEVTGRRAQAAMQGIDTGRSKVGQQMAAGGTAGLNANQRKSALRALAKAEQQITKTNLNVQTGMYKNASAKQLAAIKQGLMGAEAASAKSGKVIATNMEKAFLAVEVQAKKTSLVVSNAFTKMGKAASFLGAGLGKLMNAFMLFAMAKMAFDFIKGFVDKANEGKPKIHDFTENVESLGKEMETIAKNVDAATKAIERQTTAANKSRVALTAITTIDFAGQMDQISSTAGLDGFNRQLEEQQKQLGALPKALTEAELALANTAKAVPETEFDMSRAIQRSSLTGTNDKLIGRKGQQEKFKFTGEREEKFGPDMLTFAPEKVKELTGAQIENNASIDAANNKLKTYNDSSKKRAEIEKGIQITTENIKSAEEIRKKGLEDLADQAARLGDVTLATMVRTGKYSEALERQEQLQRFLANDKAFTSSLNAAKDITSMSASEALVYLETLQNQAQAQTDLAGEINAAGESAIAATDAQEALNEAFESAGIKVTEYTAALKLMKAEDERIQAAQSQNKVDQINNQVRLSGLVREAEAEDLAVHAKKLERDKTMNALERARAEAKKTGQDVDVEANRLALQAAQQAHNQAQASYDTAVKLADDGFKIMQAASKAFEDSLVNGLMGILDGTMSVKEAFKSMAKMMIAEIMKVTVKMMVLKALSPPGFADGGIATGGMPSTTGRSYATGGIPKGSKRGYQATLHGTEAVVPLPNGRSIPVQLEGGGGGDTNNVTINISNSSQGGDAGSGNNNQSQKDITSDNARLARALSAAVQEELKKQKRPGGILSPYGAS